MVQTIRTSGRRRIRRGTGMIGDLLGSFGLGRRRPKRPARRPRRISGAGFFDFIKDAAKAALPIIGNVASNVGTKLLMSRLGMGKKKRRTVHRKRRIGGIRRRVISV